MEITTRLGMGWKYESMAEKHVQKAVHKYVTLQYPDVICFGNYYTAVAHTGKLTRQQRGRMSQEANAQGFLKGQPDYYIESAQRGFYGLRLEIKTLGKDPFKIMPRKSCIRLMNESREGQHLRQQARVLSDYNTLGYFACFAAGFDQAKKIIDWYMAAAPAEFEQFKFYYGNGYVPIEIEIPKLKTDGK